MKRLSVQGFDFSQTNPFKPSQTPTTSAGGADYIEFSNDVFGYFYPSDAGTVAVRDSTFQWIELDKLVSNFECYSCTVTGNLQATGAAAVTSGSGTLYAEFDNCTFLSHVNAFPRTFVLNNDTFYANPSSPYGFLQNDTGYAEAATYNNPMLLSRGVKEGGLYGAGGGFTVTVQTTPTKDTFTVSGVDVERTIQVAGAGTQVKDHATGAVLGVISDVYLNGADLTVSGVWTVTPSPNQVIELNINPLTVSVTNPTALDFDINDVPPAFDATSYANVKNFTMRFSNPTTVPHLGPCNSASTRASKWVSDAVSETVLGSGGGQITMEVYCQGTSQFGGAYTLTEPPN
jgi:hypothetical protein